MGVAMLISTLEKPYKSNLLRRVKHKPNIMVTTIEEILTCFMNCSPLINDIARDISDPKLNCQNNSFCQEIPLTSLRDALASESNTPAKKPVTIPRPNEKLLFNRPLNTNNPNNEIMTETDFCLLIFSLNKILPRITEKIKPTPYSKNTLIDILVFIAETVNSITLIGNIAEKIMTFSKSFLSIFKLILYVMVRMRAATTTIRYLAVTWAYTPNILFISLINTPKLAYKNAPVKRERVPL